MTRSILKIVAACPEPCRRARLCVRHRRARTQARPTNASGDLEAAATSPCNFSVPLAMALAVVGSVRLACAVDPNHSQTPGVVIEHSPASSGIYVGSPGIAILPSGEYLAKCDEYGPQSTERQLAVTHVFCSSDRGESWRREATVDGIYWASLFVHRNAAYIMGTSRYHGEAVIVRSTDGGRNWSSPEDGQTGILLTGAKYHCAPVPMVVHRGRIWRAMEDAMGPSGWGGHFRAFMMSAPVDADLLRAESWICSNRLARGAGWLGGQFNGWLEGNAVETPDGQIVNILRVDYPPKGGKAAVVRLSADGATATFDPETDFIDFPGGGKKFTIRPDRKTGCYWALTNYVPPRHRDGNPERTRNTLALVRSENLRDWSVRSIVLYHPDPSRHGFQYVDWLVDGDDVVAVSRTAYDDGLGGAENQHDANYITFHRLRNFRELTMRDSVMPACEE